MSNSEITTRLLYDFYNLTSDEFSSLAVKLPIKIVRWLATIHPDNRSRKSLLRLSNVQIGEGSVININFVISDDYKKLLTIGSRVAISPGVSIICCSAPNNSHLKKNKYVQENLIVEKEVIIGDDVWIGCNVVILPGVKIGESAIIGAGSVVSKDVDAFSIYTGSPSKKIRNIKE